jgi:hypothetical protein
MRTPDSILNDADPPPPDPEPDTQQDPKASGAREDKAPPKPQR